MLGHTDLISFVATTRPDAARRFYGDTLGLELVEAGEHALAFRSGDTMLRVQIVPEFAPQPFTVAGWAVADICAALNDLKDKGITPVQYDFLEQDELGVWSPAPGVKVAWFRDPDGNTLSLTEFGGD